MFGTDEQTIYGPDRSKLYNLDASYNNIRIKITEERYNLLKNKLGDGTYEIMNESKYSYQGKKEDNKYVQIVKESGNAAHGTGLYNKDCVHIGNCAGGINVIRGGNVSAGSNPGIFAVYICSYSKTTNWGFRPTLIA